MSWDENEERIDHPAFGQIEISHVSGQTNLFMVDYPQGHFLTLRIHNATLHRHLSNDWVHDKSEIIEIAMSQIQWAQLLSSANSGGVPCTLLRYRDAVTGKLIEPRLPEQHVASPEKYSAEVAKTAKEGAAAMKAALEAVEAMLAGGSLKKGDLQAAKAKLEKAQMEITQNLPFVVQQAEEKIEAAVVSGKGEVAAHSHFIMTKLGERVLGERVQQIVEAGGDVAHIGEAITAALLPPRKES